MHQKKPVQGIEQPTHLAVGNVAPGRDLAVEDHRRQVVTFVAGQADPVGEEECFAASLLDAGIDWRRDIFGHRTMIPHRVTREMTYGDGFELLGRLIVAAHGLDTAFMEQGRCRLPEHFDPITGERIEHKDPLTRKTIWMVDFHDIPEPGKPTPRELINVALLICHSCPVQYECAHYAVDAEIRSGTYSARLANIKWLQRTPLKAHALIEEARAAGESVEHYVSPVRAEDERLARARQAEASAERDRVAALIGTG